MNPIQLYSISHIVQTVYRLFQPTAIFLLLLVSNHVNAVDVTITGSTIVCPNKSITYTVNTYQIPFGWNVNTCGYYLWGIKKDGVLIDEISGSTLTYVFEDVGNYEVGVVASRCQPYFGGSAAISVVSRVVPPNPISGPAMCFSGQSYSYTTSPSLASQNPLGSECYYHYEYLWTAPLGWSINGGGNTLFDHSETVGITAPVGTPAGSYTISVQSSIPNPAQSNYWYSSPKTYSVQVGAFASSQVSVSGTAAVCNGNSYTYTVSIPGGHNGGYTYNWTYPSGWSVESTSANTIRLYVPSYNSSYGTVRVSVNNGCGATSSTGITVYPCSYMMSTGSFKVYPIPAQGEINIEFLAQEANSEVRSNSAQYGGDSDSKAEVFRVQVFDHTEQVVRAGESNDGKVHLDTRGLRPGSYFLHIYYGKEIVREQILIQ